jgi:hypothetical protein
MSNESRHIIEDTDRYDADEIGPFDRCIRCFTPFGDDRAYCAKCGKNSGWSFYPTEVSPNAKLHCVFHPSAEFDGFCGMCARPICATCVGTPGYSLITGLRLITCPECDKNMKALEIQYFHDIAEKGCCSKHPHKKATTKCASCSINLCDSCKYYEKAEGPFCLTCYRDAARPRKYAEYERIKINKIIKTWLMLIPSTIFTLFGLTIIIKSIEINILYFALLWVFIPIISIYLSHSVTIDSPTLQVIKVGLTGLDALLSAVLLFNNLIIPPLEKYWKQALSIRSFDFILNIFAILQLALALILPMMTYIVLEDAIKRRKDLESLSMRHR